MNIYMEKKKRCRHKWFKWLRLTGKIQLVCDNCGLVKDLKEDRIE